MHLLRWLFNIIICFNCLFMLHYRTIVVAVLVETSESDKLVDKRRHNNDNYLDSGGGINRCCQDNQVLINDGQYICVDGDDRGFSFIKSKPLYLNHLQNLYSLLSDQYCKTINSTIIRDQLTFDQDNEYCIDILRSNLTNETSVIYLTITCEYDLDYFEPAENFQTVTVLNKCCKFGFVYNSSDMTCSITSDNTKSSTSSDNNQHVQPLTNLTSIMLESNIDCDGTDEVIVEYNLWNKNFELKIDNGISLVINDGSKAYASSSNKFCIDQMTSDNNIGLLAFVCESKDFCKSHICIRQCCAHEKIIQVGSDSEECIPNLRGMAPKFYYIKNWLKTNEVIENTTVKEFGIAHGLSCEKFLLEPSENRGDEYYLNAETGNLHVRYFATPITNDRYCLEHVDYGDGYIKLEAFICFGGEVQDTKAFDIHTIAITTSCLFFALTLLTYSCLPKLQNTHGKVLMGNNCCFLVAYTIVSVNRFHGAWHAPSYCEISAYLIYFGYMSGFFWLNVMCFDIWGTFRSMKVSRGVKNNSARRKFALYCLYAVVTPTVLVSIMLWFQYTETLPEKWRPKLGMKKCWFDAHDDALPRIIFFLTPIGLITLCNFILFIHTVVHCNKIKANINRMQRSSGTDPKKRFLACKARLIMSLKFFIVMGASWILEVSSTIFSAPSSLWFVTDFFNSLLGLFVFLIFVCKRKVFLQIKKRFGFDEVKPPTAGVTDTTSLRTTRPLSKSPGVLNVNKVNVVPFNIGKEL